MEVKINMIKFQLRFHKFIGITESIYHLYYAVQNSVQELVKEFNHEIGYDSSSIVLIGVDCPVTDKCTSLLLTGIVEDNDKCRVIKLATQIKEECKNSTVKVEFYNVDMEEV